ncbi:MAG: hypothetical protein ABIS14_11265, partial [Sphingomonas sp.]
MTEAIVRRSAAQRCGVEQSLPHRFAALPGLGQSSELGTVQSDPECRGSGDLRGGSRGSLPILVDRP